MSKEGGSMLTLVERFLAEARVKRIQTKTLEDYLIKTLTLQGYWEKGGYPAFAALIAQLVAENRLKPVKARERNGMNPPLFNWYQRITAQEGFSLEEQRRLLKLYHPKLFLTGGSNSAVKRSIAPGYSRCAVRSLGARLPWRLKSSA
jgi:hypothetical protein